MLNTPGGLWWREKKKSFCWSFAARLEKWHDTPSSPHVGVKPFFLCYMWEHFFLNLRFYLQVFLWVIYIFEVGGEKTPPLKVCRWLMQSVLCVCVIQPGHTHTHPGKQNPSTGLKAEASTVRQAVACPKRGRGEWRGSISGWLRTMWYAAPIDHSEHFTWIQNVCSRRRRQSPRELNYGSQQTAQNCGCRKRGSGGETVTQRGFYQQLVFFFFLSFAGLLARPLVIITPKWMLVPLKTYSATKLIGNS